MLSVFMLSVVMLSVVMLSFVDKIIFNVKPLSY